MPDDKPIATYSLCGVARSGWKMPWRVLAGSGMTARQWAGPGTCRSFGLNRSASFDPKRLYGDRGGYSRVQP
jgi:hypothetical protein